MNPGVKRREPRTLREEEGGVFKMEEEGRGERAGAELCRDSREMLAAVVP